MKKVLLQFFFIILFFVFSALSVNCYAGVFSDDDTEVIVFNDSDKSCADTTIIQVEIDGKKVASLKKKEYRSFSFKSGRHRIGVQQIVDDRTMYGWAANVNIRKGKFYVQVDAIRGLQPIRLADCGGRPTAQCIQCPGADALQG